MTAPRGTRDVCRTAWTDSAAPGPRDWSWSKGHACRDITPANTVWAVAAGVSAGWGLKRAVLGWLRGAGGGRSRRLSRLGVETGSGPGPPRRRDVAAGVSAGWGLKPTWAQRRWPIKRVAAGVSAGWGLKHRRLRGGPEPRPVAAGVSAGWGLKPARVHAGRDGEPVAAGVSAGWGLKHMLDTGKRDDKNVAAGVSAGWGLKHVESRHHAAGRGASQPASQPAGG